MELFSADEIAQKVKKRPDLRGNNSLVHSILKLCTMYKLALNKIEDHENEKKEMIEDFLKYKPDYLQIKAAKREQETADKFKKMNPYKGYRSS